MRACLAFRLVPLALILHAPSARESTNPPLGNPNATLDRPFTLRAPEPEGMELEHNRQILSDGPRTSIFPRACVSEIDSSRVCDSVGGYTFSDGAREGSFRISPLADVEFRDLGERAGALDFGLVADGHSGPVSFYVDARMFSEAHEDRLHPSYDREFVERQDEQASGTLAYSSYSRFRSNLSYDMSWARITVARDAAHWGPGLWHNLSFNQASIPFNHVTLTAHLGPLSVQSLYGRLALDQDWERDSTGEHRSLHAHRYEWRVTRDVVLGVSEQLVLRKAEAPFAFVPVVPLYIAKAAESEKLNNGNISGDVSWRAAGSFAVYSEFLIDDIQSPTSLFNDDWGNKWAWMAGAHWAGQGRGMRGGAVAEYSRLEPWVYTHKRARGSQTAHFDHPLGNQAGPNSQTGTVKAYLRRPGFWYASLRLDLAWKGTDPGSHLLDIHDGGSDRKRFLYGVGSPSIRLSPQGWVRWRRASLFAQAALGSEPEAVAGISFRY